MKKVSLISRRSESKAAAEGMQVTEMLYSRGYRLGPRIGKGSYAKVKVAERLSDDKIMAAKIVSRRRAAKEFLDKFLPRELSVILSLSHRNIIQVYEIMQTEECVCIMMEYASRGDLLDYIKRRGVLQEDEAGLLFAQVCQGVSYLHNRNICHRDLKCENILLRRNMTVALSDFGFSKALQTHNTLSSTYCGSAAYASPELLRGTPYSPLQNDIWSLGCIIFIMVTGQMPFCDKNTKKMMYRQLKGKVNFPDHRNVSVTCRSLIGSTLEPNTDLRFTIKAVLSHLWLQPFVHLFDKTFRNHPEQQTAYIGSNPSTMQSISPMREMVKNESSSILASSIAMTTATEEKDTWNQSIYYNILMKKSSHCSNDSANENSYSLMYNTSLCRMPGEACIFRGIKEREHLLLHEDETSESENRTRNVSSASSDQRAPSESSVCTIPSSSILLSSVAIDPAILLNKLSPVRQIPQSRNQEMHKDTTVKTGDQSADQNLKMRIQQILHVPFSKTNNSKPLEDKLTSSSVGAQGIDTRFPGSQNTCYSTSTNLTHSVSMMKVHQSKTKLVTRKYMSSTAESTAFVTQFKRDVNVEQTHMYQAGLVTQMRRIFESKTTSTSTNDRSPEKY